MRTISIFIFLSVFVVNSDSYALDTWSSKKSLSQDVSIDLDSLSNSIGYASISDKAIYKLMTSATKDKDYPLAIAYSNLYLRRGKEKKNNNIEFDAYYYLAYLFYTQGNTSEVVINIDLAMNNLPQENLKNKATNALILKGSSYMISSDYNNAMKAYLEADSYIDTEKITEQKLSTKISIAQCKIRIKRFEDALKDLQYLKNLIDNKLTIQKLSAHNQKEIPFTVYNGIGICYRELGLHKKSITILLKNLEKIKSDNLPKNFAITYLNIGKTYHAMENYEKTEHYIKLSRGILIELNSKNENFVIANYFLADCLFKKGNFYEAKKYIDEITSIIESNKKMENAVEIMELAIQNAEKLNDQESETAYRKLLTNIQKDLYTDRNKTKDFLFDKKLQDLELDKKKLLFSNKQNKNYIRIIVLGILFAMVGLIYYNKKQRKKNKVLFDKFIQSFKESNIQSSNQQMDIKTLNTPGITDEKARNILNELSILEKSFFYLNTECTLHSTAQRLHTNTTYLSKIINQYKNQSFNSYINKLRISYAIKQLNSGKKYKSYSVKGISEDLGYKSVNTFNNAFKKVTNLSPSFYLKQLQQKEFSEL